MFTVEHYLASRSYLMCPHECRDVLTDFPVPNKSTDNISSGKPFAYEWKRAYRNFSGRAWVSTDDSLGDIRQALLSSLRKSPREFSLQSGFSYGSLHKVIKILKLHPYRLHVVHELKQPDKEKWLDGLHT
jgi:hypothetical protein